MKAYLYGLSCLNGFMYIKDNKKEIYIALPGVLKTGYVDAHEVIKESPLSKAVFVYRGQMPLFEYVGVE